MKRRCPYCNSSHSLAKAGHNRSGTQRYRCKCGRTHTKEARDRSLNELKRLAAALLFQAGYSLRDAASILAVSQQTVKNCSELFGAEIVVTFDESIYESPAFSYLAERFHDESDDY
jgi:transposase-like protein